MSYKVFGGTLSLTQSINQSIITIVIIVGLNGNDQFTADGEYWEFANADYYLRASAAAGCDVTRMAKRRPTRKTTAHMADPFPSHLRARPT